MLHSMHLLTTNTSVVRKRGGMWAGHLRLPQGESLCQEGGRLLHDKADDKRRL